MASNFKDECGHLRTKIKIKNIHGRLKAALIKAATVSLLWHIDYLSESKQDEIADFTESMSRNSIMYIIITDFVYNKFLNTN